MRKKMITGFIVLAFACWSLLLMSSCATQEAQVSDVMEPTAPEMDAEDVQEAVGKQDLGSLKGPKEWPMRSESLNPKISTSILTSRT